jgi:hypothetical protein
MSEISNQFTGLPIRDLIGGPLMAACEAQSNLARSTADFIQTIGFKYDDKGNRLEELSMVDFKYSQLQADGSKKNIELEVPLLSIVKVPSLAIKNVDIQFDMEVKSSTSETSKTAAEFSSSVSSGWFGVKVEIKGSVSTSKENTRNTDTSAKYHINLHAADDGMPEGLSRVLDILNAVIIPEEKTAEKNK